mmetsp:Transcript_50627/g.134836  ORF Transcript_50627/g.134836 Transcript_50627/m.134836 type:complete len:246 (-) Transcript_50627:554-1291(-)
MRWLSRCLLWRGWLSEVCAALPVGHHFARCHEERLDMLRPGGRSRLATLVHGLGSTLRKIQVDRALTWISRKTKTDQYLQIFWRWVLGGCQSFHVRTKGALTTSEGVLYRALQSHASAPQWQWMLIVSAVLLWQLSTPARLWRRVKSGRQRPLRFPSRLEASSNKRLLSRQPTKGISRLVGRTPLMRPCRAPSRKVQRNGGLMRPCPAPPRKDQWDDNTTCTTIAPVQVYEVYMGASQIHAIARF